MSRIRIVLAIFAAVTAPRARAETSFDAAMLDVLERTGELRAFSLAPLESGHCDRGAKAMLEVSVAKQGRFACLIRGTDQERAVICAEARDEKRCGAFDHSTCVAGDAARLCSAPNARSAPPWLATLVEVVERTPLAKIPRIHATTADLRLLAIEPTDGAPSFWVHTGTRWHAIAGEALGTPVRVEPLWSAEKLTGAPSYALRSIIITGMGSGMSEGIVELVLIVDRPERAAVVRKPIGAWRASRSEDAVRSTREASVCCSAWRSAHTEVFEVVLEPRVTKAGRLELVRTARVQIPPESGLDAVLVDAGEWCFERDTLLRCTHVAK